MALVNTGTRRTMNLSVTKTGNDGSTFVMSTTSTPAYPDFDGKKAFGLYPEITEQQMQELSDSDFIGRVAAWQVHLQSAYSVSDPNLWGDIGGSFSYVNGVIVRLYFDYYAGALKTTVLGGSISENVITKIVDLNGDTLHQFTIMAGTTESVTSYGSSPMLQSIKDDERFVLVTPEFFDYQHFDVFVEITENTYYPIP